MPPERSGAPTLRHLRGHSTLKQKHVVGQRLESKSPNVGRRDCVILTRIDRAFGVSNRRTLASVPKVPGVRGGSASYAIALRAMNVLGAVSSTVTSQPRYRRRNSSSDTGVRLPAAIVCTR